MESFSETRIEADLFSHDAPPCPEIDVAISKEQVQEAALDTEKDVQNINRKVKRGKKSKCKNGCSKDESRLIQSLEQERSKNRQQRLKRMSERHWDVMARRSRKLSSRAQKVQRAPKAPKAQKVPKAQKAQKAQKVPKAPKAQKVPKAQKAQKVQKSKRKKPHSKRHQITTSANSEPLGIGSNPWTRWTTPPPGQ